VLDADISTHDNDSIKARDQKMKWRASTVSRSKISFPPDFAILDSIDLRPSTDVIRDDTCIHNYYFLFFFSFFFFFYYCKV
jgi:hypothetical protein